MDVPGLFRGGVLVRLTKRYNKKWYGLVDLVLL